MSGLTKQTPSGEGGSYALLGGCRENVAIRKSERPVKELALEELEEGISSLNL